MPKNQDSLNVDLARQLKRFRPTMRNTSGKVVPVPEEADVFQFHFVMDDKDYGTVTVSIDGLHKLVVYYGNDVEDSPNVSEHGDLTWTQLLVRLKQFAYQHQLSFELSDQDDLESDMAKREHTKRLDEGYKAINKKTSVNDSVPTVKVRIQHSRDMTENDQRFRHVEKIFIENSDGERILAPTTKPGVARIYARHIAEGGRPYDERWNHLNSLVEEYTKMAGFVRATRDGQFNESTQKLVTEGINHYLSLRESLHKLTGKKGYNAYFESWTPPLMEDEITEDLSGMFMTSSLDPRIESVMPILSKLSKNISETKMNEVSELEQWAENLTALNPEKEADYDDEYQSMVQRVGKKAKAQEKKKPVDIDALAKKLKAIDSKRKVTDEGEIGATLGTIAGAALGKSPTAAAIGGQVGDKIGDAIGNKLAGGNVEEDSIGSTIGGKLGDQLQKDLTQEAGPAGKPGDQLGATDKVSTGKVLGNKPQTQKGLRGKLVGESDTLSALKRLSGI